jgi:hypothetical protein
MAGTPADPLAATINNDFDNVIAANQSSGCTVYFGPSTVAATPAPACFYAMQSVNAATQVPGGQWQVTFSNTAGWPQISDASGTFYPIPMIPDQLAGFRIGDFNDYLVPVYGPSGFGYLMVEEVFPLVPGPRTYKVAGFQGGGSIPGKYENLVDGQVYTLTAYTADAGGSYSFLRTDRSVTVSGGKLTVTSKAVTGGSFGYFVTDMTGALQMSALVPY